jgi:signal transduction histidine kinase
VVQGWDGKAPAGMGLRIMGYRTDNLGGVLSVQSELNAGTEIKCIFPNGFP